MTEEMGGAKPFSDEDKIHLFLAYFGILCLIPFLMFKDKRDDPQKEFVYWHGREGLALAIVATAVFIVGSVISFILGMVLGAVTLGIGGLLTPCIMLLLFLAVMGVNIMCWVKAFGGQKWKIPLVHKVAEMFN